MGEDAKAGLGREQSERAHAVRPYDDAFSVEALHRAYLRALKRHRGQPEAAAFTLECGPRLVEMSRGVRDGTWLPSPGRAFPIRDPKPRVVVMVPFADRVVHHALVAALEPAIDPLLDPDSFACRRDRGIHQALARAQTLLHAHPYYLGLDVEHYFPSVPHATLIGILTGFGVPRPYLDLFQLILDGDAHGADRGMSIGALTSQFLGSIGLDPVERMLRADFPDCAHVRYMDDIVVFGPEKKRLWTARDACRQELERLGLVLKASATRLAPSTEGLTFLGCRVFRATIRLRRSRQVLLGRHIREAEHARREGCLDEERATASIATRLAHAASFDTLTWRQDLVRRLWP